MLEKLFTTYTKIYFDFSYIYTFENIFNDNFVENLKTL